MADILYGIVSRFHCIRDILPTSSTLHHPVPKAASVGISQILTVTNFSRQYSDELATVLDVIRLSRRRDGRVESSRSLPRGS